MLEVDLHFTAPPSLPCLASLWARGVEWKGERGKEETGRLAGAEAR